MPDIIPTEQLPFYGLWIQTGAIIVSAIGIIITALWMKRIACRRATLDILLMEESNPEIIRTRTNFVKLRDDGNLPKWVAKDNTHSEESAILRSVLNRYELVAIGIDKGIIDEAAYKAWCRTTLVKDWTDCKALVVQLRLNANIPDYYKQFEKLAQRWAKPEERRHI